MSSCRLQYIEFSASSTKAAWRFRPLAYNTHYVNIHQA